MIAENLIFRFNINSNLHNFSWKRTKWNYFNFKLELRFPLDPFRIIKQFILKK